MATVTTRAGLRSRSDRIQGAAAKVPVRDRRITEVAPMTSRCCQSNANSSPSRRTLALRGQDLSHDQPPLGQRGRASLAVNFAADEMALLAEMVVD